MGKDKPINNGNSGRPNKSRNNGDLDNKSQRSSSQSSREDESSLPCHQTPNQYLNDNIEFKNPDLPCDDCGAIQGDERQAQVTNEPQEDTVETAYPRRRNNRNRRRGQNSSSGRGGQRGTGLPSRGRGVPCPSDENEKIKPSEKSIKEDVKSNKESNLQEKSSTTPVLSEMEKLLREKGDTVIHEVVLDNDPNLLE